MGREYDVIVYGATGFTGRQAALYFQEHVGTRLKWAIAGRNHAKLQALGINAPIEVADALDRDAIDRLVQQTRVILTTAGPYAKYGDALVDACARYGTDYVDITGESPWVRAIIDRVEEQARTTKTRIIPFCGFDSVPSDLGAMMVARALQDRGDTPSLVKASYSMTGGLNGGTLDSALTMADQGANRKMGDPALLNPLDTRSADRSQAVPDQRRARYDEDLQVWTAPFIMAEVNTRVVRRSAALLAQDGEGYGPGFRYTENMKCRNRLQAWGITLVLGASIGAFQSSVLRGLVRRLGPNPGEGPSEAVMENGFFRVRLFGRGEGGTVVRGEITSEGDPGNISTVRMLCESACALVEDRDALPERYGVLTPASGLGQVLLDRLTNTGRMTFSVDP